MNIGRGRGKSDANRTKDYRSRCSRCLLPETFPGIQFDDNHVCNYCGSYEKKAKERGPAWEEGRRAWMEGILRSKRGRRDHDCLVSYSGGKDSTYLLHLLKEEYGLRVLAYTCDTGFMSEAAHRNIEKTLARLPVDHVWDSPGDDFYRRLYSHMLTHPGGKQCVKTVCGQCFKVTSMQAVRIAAERDIPLVAYGFSPAQFRGTRCYIRRIYLMGGFLYLRFLPNKSFPIGLHNEERRHFHLGLRDLRKMPVVLFPFQALDYDLHKINETVLSLGLIAPGDEHPLRSNCLINLLMIELDSLRFKYNPYVTEFSQLVREGQIDRQEWLELEDKIMDEIENRAFERDKIDDVLERLGLTDYYQRFITEALQGREKSVSRR